MTRLVEVPQLRHWAGEMRGIAPSPNTRLRTVVAIPAKDEASRLLPCLQALAGQRDLRGGPLDAQAFGVLLLLNNCSDDSASVAGQLATELPYHLCIKQRLLPPNCANAGFARRFAMDAAAGWLLATGREDGFLLTTDADTRVAPDWIARHEDAFEKDIDAVAGYVLEDPDEYQFLPPSLRRRSELEDSYTRLLTELESRLDPVPHDPWPRHSMAAGASLGLTLDWYRRVGGLPLLPVGEDRALVSRLLQTGARIRHCLETQVVTSCRLAGRATGGMAETMRARIADPGALCDEQLLPAVSALYQFFWRGVLRRQYAIGGLVNGSDWPSALRLTDFVPHVVFPTDFNAAREVIMRDSPGLASHRLRPNELPNQISRAVQILDNVRLDQFLRTVDDIALTFWQASPTGKAPLVSKYAAGGRGKLPA